MITMRTNRSLRRLGYGIAFGAGLACAPLAVGAASADPGAPAATVDQPTAAQAAPAGVRVVGRQVAAQRTVGRVSLAPRIAADNGGSSVVVIGASVSSGKSVTASSAYPRRVAAITGRPVYVSAHPGAGYGDGSMAALTQAANIPGRNPSLVVLQAGSNDVGESRAAVASEVRQVVSTVRREAPGAKIALVTVFPSLHRGNGALATDATIVGAARSVDPSVAVISPLEEGWQYRAARDGHPGAGAHERIAERVAALA